jgi:hypothetical protein
VVYANGDVYEGDFLNDRRHGNGVFTGVDGYVYVGEWREGRIEGQGQVTYPDGSVYVGAFRNDLAHGQGTITYPDASSYEGDWVDGVIQGSGVARYANGLVYEGQFLNARQHGQGVMSHPDGYRYEGQWEDGLRHGQGIAVYADGTVYEGTFVAGQREGEGTLTMPDGFRYVGAWDDGEINGMGIATYTNGDVYEGMFVNGRRQGAGRDALCLGRGAGDRWEAGLPTDDSAPAPAAEPDTGEVGPDRSGRGERRLSFGRPSRGMPGLIAGRGSKRAPARTRPPKGGCHHALQSTWPERPVRLGAVPRHHDLRRVRGPVGPDRPAGAGGRRRDREDRRRRRDQLHRHGQCLRLDGRSEEILGQSIRNLGLKREELVIATKVHGQMGEGPNARGASRGHILDQAKASLKRLQLDHIDLYQIHGFDPATPIEETLEALDTLVRHGHVRYVGLSNWAAWQVMKAVGHGRDAPPRARRLACRPTTASPGATWSGRSCRCCCSEGIGLMVWSPLAGGFLSGKFDREGTTAEGRRVNFDFPPVDKDRAYDAIDLMRTMAATRAAPSRRSRSRGCCTGRWSPACFWGPNGLIS